MAIGDVFNKYRDEAGATQTEWATELNFHRSLISKIESGVREWPESSDAKLPGLSWKFALHLMNERTGGYISNILEDIPGLDLHPSAIKELWKKEMDEAEEAIGGLIMARHVDKNKRKESAELAYHEIRDVIEKGLVLLGVLEEEFGLDRDKLSQQHKKQIERGER